MEKLGRGRGGGGCWNLGEMEKGEGRVLGGGAVGVKKNKGGGGSGSERRGGEGKERTGSRGEGGGRQGGGR